MNNFSHTIKGSREWNVKIGGKKYLMTSDDDYLEQIKSGFEPEMVDLFRSLVKETYFVLDIGANVGCTSILFGELAEKVYSFEPSPTTFEFLRENISKSGLSNIELINFALGAEEGATSLTYATNNRAGGFISDLTKVGKGHTTETIKIKKLDDLINELKIRKIDFMKIDVEGFEKNVLNGSLEALNIFKPIVVMELNHWCLNAFRRITVPDFLDFLNSIFPILFAIDGSTYVDVHDDGKRYHVMYNHIIHFKYKNLVGAFDNSQLVNFFKVYRT